MKYRPDPGTIAGSMIVIAVVALAMFLLVLGMRAHAKTWDRDAISSEQGRIRHEYLSKAGTLPVYREGRLTSETFYANCCGEADAYEADEVAVDADGSTWAVLTCNDQDNCKQVCSGQICKIVRPAGSRWKVPPERVLLNHDPKNNTGHGWVYISPSTTGPNGNAAVLCWAAPPGA
jgi:hypothetical protein